MSEESTTWSDVAELLPTKLLVDQLSRARELGDHMVEIKFEGIELHVSRGMVRTELDERRYEMPNFEGGTRHLTPDQLAAVIAPTDNESRRPRAERVTADELAAQWPGFKRYIVAPNGELFVAIVGEVFGDLEDGTCPKYVGIWTVSETNVGFDRLSDIDQYIVDIRNGDVVDAIA